MDGRPMSRSESLSALHQTYFQGDGAQFNAETTYRRGISRSTQGRTSRGGTQPGDFSKSVKYLRTANHKRPQTSPAAPGAFTVEDHVNTTLGLVPFHPTSFTPSSLTKKTFFGDSLSNQSNALPPLLKSFAADSVLPSDHLTVLLEDVNTRIKSSTYNLPEYDLDLQLEQERKTTEAKILHKLQVLTRKAPKENIGTSLLLAKGRPISPPKSRTRGAREVFDVSSLFPTSHKKSKASIKKAVRKAHKLQLIKQQYYKPTRRAPPTIAPVFSATSIISNCYQTAQEVEYLQNFAWDKHLYQSTSMWAEKTVAEARELTAPPTCMSHNIFISVLTSLLLSIEKSIGSMVGENLKFAVDNILRSVFILGSGVKATNLSTLTLLGRREAEDFNPPEGLKGDRSVLKIISKCPTWFHAVQYWQQRLDKELKLQPYLQKLREKMDREKQIENGVLNRTCTAWTLPYMSLVVDNWRSLSALDHNLHLLGKYLLKCTELKPSMIFQAWKKWATDERLNRADEDKEKVIKAWELLKKELEETLARVSKKSVALSKMTLEKKKVQKKLDDALAILNSPPRQPPTLAKTVKSFSKSLSGMKAFLDPHIEEVTEDTLKTDASSLRLGWIYKWKADLGDMTFIPNPDLRVEYVDPSPASASEDKIEELLDSWKPGTLKGAEEHSEAFAPSKSKSGKVILDWIVGTLKSQWTRLGMSCEEEKLRRLVDSDGIGLEGQESVALLKDVFLEVAKLHPKMSDKDFLKSLESYGDIDDNSSVESLEDDVYVKFHEANPHVHECNANIDALMKVVIPSGYEERFRYITQEDFTMLKEPESKKKRMIRLAHLNQAKKREENSGIVVNTFSSYMGRRVPIIESQVQKRFAFFADLFFASFDKFQVIPGLSSWFRKSRSETSAAWEELTALHTDLAYYEPLHYTHEELKEMAEKMGALWKGLNSKTGDMMRAHRECLVDRRRYREFCPNCVRLVWQSLCTTVLSRKVRVEADIDDGTYTKLVKLRLAAEYKRIGILSNVIMDEDIEAMREILKGRIRDMKQMFQFYAAAEQGGDANTMDSVEFKKFVRDTKLQKDRKVLPSVRVDLVFQQCCIDHEKTGKARIADGTDDIDGNKFVESIARLASYKYDHLEEPLGPRLNKILIDDVLPNACSIDVDVFRDRCGGDRVKDVFDLHKHNLKVIFSSYAADDTSSDDAIASADTMNVGELVGFGRDFDLIGGPPLLSERAMRVLFAYVQQEDPDAADEAGNAVEDDDSEMVISEFQEALAAVGSQLYPDPYNVFDMKLSQFLRKEVVSAALKMLRFRKLGAPPKGLKPLKGETAKNLDVGGSRPGSPEH